METYTPNIGQSAVTFILQISGSSIGYLIGLALLEVGTTFWVFFSCAHSPFPSFQIFRNVGGYIFNPYGITCLVALYSLPMQYLIVSYFTNVSLDLHIYLYLSFTLTVRETKILCSRPLGTQWNGCFDNYRVGLSGIL